MPVDMNTATFADTKAAIDMLLVDTPVADSTAVASSMEAGSTVAVASTVDAAKAA